MACSRIEFNEQLICQIELRPSIWDISNIDYKNCRVKENDWKEVAKILKSSEAEIYKKWESLKDMFIKQLKSYKENQKELNISSKNWRHFKQMMFLKDNIESENSNHQLFPLGKQEISSDIEILENNNMENGSTFESSPITSTPAAILPDSIDDDDDDCNFSLSIDKSYSSNSKLKSEKKKRIYLPRTELNPKRDIDDVEHFMLSLCKYVRETPSHLQGLCQMQLLQVAVSFSNGKVPTTLISPDIFSSTTGSKN